MTVQKKLLFLPDEKKRLRYQTALDQICELRRLKTFKEFIEDSFDDAYDFILTARFQNDPLERRFGQYRQIKGGLKEDIDIAEKIKISFPGEMEVMKLETDYSLGISLDALMLSPDSGEVVVHIAGYTTKKYLKKIKM